VAHHPARPAAPGRKDRDMTGPITDPPRTEVADVPAGPDGASVGVARASAVMAAGTLASRILGFVRASLLVVVLGAAASDLAANAFAVANTLPAALYLLIAGGALNAVLVPQIVRADAEGPEGRVRLDRLLTLALTGLLVVTAALTAAAGVLVQLYTSSWPADQVALAVAFAAWSIPQVFFFGLYALFGQVLNARGSFGPYTWAPVANNLVAIGGLVAVLAVAGTLRDRPPDAFGPGLVAALAGTATLGVVTQAVVLLPWLRAVGFRFRPRWRWRGAGLRSAGSVAAWTFAALVVSQLAYLVLTNVASAAGQAAVETGIGDTTASVAAWQPAFLLFMLPHSIIAVSVVTAQFTGFSRAAGARDLDRLRADSSAAVRMLIVGMAPAATALVVLAQPVAMLLFGADIGQGTAIASVLVVMAVGLPAFSVTYQLQRVWYALTDGRTPFLVAAVSSGLWIAAMIVLSLAVPPRLVVPGAALALSATQVLSAVLLVLALRRRLGRMDVRGLAGVGLRSLLAAVLAGALTAGVLLVAGVNGAEWRTPLPSVETRWDALAPVLGGGALVLVGYLAAAWALRLSEVARIGSSVRRALRRRPA
jgi:putative peptidoglycan lipid II flippase